MFQSDTKLIAIAIALVGLLATTQDCAAGSVKTTQDSKTGDVRVIADDVTVDEILRQLAEDFQFEIERHDGELEGELRVTAKYAGSLSTIVKRLLRNRNFLITRRTDDLRIIEKVVILANSTKPPAPKAPAAAKPPKAKVHDLEP